jgi:arylsulfatase
MGMRQKYPDRKPVHGVPYEGIENLRPETQDLVKSFLAGKAGK